MCQCSEVSSENHLQLACLQTAVQKLWLENTHLFSSEIFKTFLGWGVLIWISRITQNTNNFLRLCTIWKRLTDKWHGSFAFNPTQKGRMVPNLNSLMTRLIWNYKESQQSGLSEYSRQEKRKHCMSQSNFNHLFTPFCWLHICLTD